MEALIKTAINELGTEEIPGAKDNDRIVEYVQESGFDWNNDDEAWCSAFMNWCALENELENSGKANARSWLEVGEEVMEPEPGDVVVYWRESVDFWKGHGNSNPMQRTWPWTASTGRTPETG